jgi:SAM-dependent methyltransferase
MTKHSATLPTKNLAVGSNSSVVVECCQVCDSPELDPVIFVGYLPPVNTMPTIGSRPAEQPAYPAQVLRCRKCQLVQLGLIVDPAILFPPTYPYTSGTTKILRENFAELYREVQSLYPLSAQDLVVDIGSNDGTLLSNFQNGGHRVFGIEPTNAGNLAKALGIATDISFFNRAAAKRAIGEHGQAKVITATNVFAHIEDVHEIVDSILDLLSDDGIFISESHYFLALLDTLQYDTIYHEHLRYYTLTSLRYLLSMHGLETIHARRIPTHGGSIRVYAARKKKYPVRDTIAPILMSEAQEISDDKLQSFRSRVVNSKLALHAVLRDVKAQGKKVYGVGAPSRASTLVNYVGLDDGILDCVVEIKGSYKIGKYLPGTMIPVLEESKLYADQPDYVLLLSWHIGDELVSNLEKKGFRGEFIVPLPTPKVIRGPSSR